MTNTSSINSAQIIPPSDIQAEAQKHNKGIALVASNNVTGDHRLILWQVGDTLVIETNGNSVWKGDEGFAADYREIEIANATQLWSTDGDRTADAEERESALATYRATGGMDWYFVNPANFSCPWEASPWTTSEEN
jgi:hypothetical protein